MLVTLPTPDPAPKSDVETIADLSAKNPDIPVAVEPRVRPRDQLAVATVAAWPVEVG
jgi:hypothetical protein